MDTDQIKRILEAALLASLEPLSSTRLAGLFTEDENVTVGDIACALEALQADASARGVVLSEVASGYRYQVAGDVHAWVARLNAERPTRYSRALLETLSLIAYRQPITRGEIEQIRGVVVSSNIIRTLEEREWIRIVGHRDVAGRPALFGTTRQFLDYFNLKALEDLPPLAEIRDLEELVPQFEFEAVLGDAGNILPAHIEAGTAGAASDFSEVPAAIHLPLPDATTPAQDPDSKEHLA
ncbi:segregation and condensation protein B [mine drainage metagenome]|uniref:Segregation and condensation protein B n=1 Tax=mine drainage metagenome TaxID=410659 RepID=T0YZ38_9ZZZZ